MSQYSGKRKLIYSPEKQVSSNSQKKIRDERKSVGKWQTFGEGFSGFGGVKHLNPPKRQRTSLIRQSEANTSRKLPTKGVDESIAWSSSDEEDSTQHDRDNSPVVRRPGPRYKASIQKDYENADSEVLIADEESSSEPWCLSSVNNKVTKDRCDSENEGQHSQVSEVAASIFSYESEGSRHSFSQKETDDKLQISPETSQDIESMKSESLAPSQASSSSKVKASDWVKTLNLKTPSKDSQSSDIDILEDSAKKKKKFKRGGFADQLHKVQMRERSSLRIWSHQQNSEETESHVSTPKIITVEVVSFELLYSLQLARCEVLTGPVEAGQILVLFSTASVQQHNIQEGSVVLIHPPWQQLDLKQTHQKVLLCTNYCQVTNKSDLHNPGSHKVKVTQQSQDVVKVMGQWNCPCVTGLVSSYQSCPAYLYPCIPAVAVSMDAACCDDEKRERSRLTVVQSTHCQPPQSSSVGTPAHTILESVHDQGSTPGGQGHSFSGLVHRVIQKQTRQTPRWCVLVEDVQGTMCEVVLPKDRLPIWDRVLKGEGAVFSFTGLMLYSRTHRERDFGLFSLIDSVWSGVVSSTLSQESDKALPEHSILSQDSNQTLRGPSTVNDGSIQALPGPSKVNDGSIQTLSGPSTVNDGSIQELSGPSTVNDGSNQALPGPSTVIDGSIQALPGPSTAAWTVEPPGFCYVMKGDNSTDIEISPVNTSGLQSRYHPLTITDLSKVSKKPTIVKRFCLVAKVLAILPSDTGDADRSHETTSHRRRPQCYLYVWTGEAFSDQPPRYSIVRVAYDVKNALCGRVMFFKDIFYHKEQLCCDVFSQILPIAAVPERCMSTNTELTIKEAEWRALQGEIIIPSVCYELPELTLCKVQGTVSGVDESSAYSWDVCSFCGSDKLVNQQSELVCMECNKSILEPVNKMTMEVCVTCDGLDVPVTISLLQDCIEKLLPEDTAEEGYEIESVLGKDIGTIFCVICSKVQKGSSQSLKLLQVAVSL
ncbi:DNA repair-scaffolding protein-like isoform X2 [Pecten maximus]|uniref:DNA repair-scaffolding protein-like isoform X2 n=1 Tax=Pecten maximus TaxID=6579 RepID=UPI001458453A|nr:DNA repair-scaffolding protein-like isoform X2 [Pecten maximus]